MSRMKAFANVNRQTGEVTPSTDQLAFLLSASPTCKELTQLKAKYGQSLCKKAWNTLDLETRDRLTALCENHTSSAKCKSCNADIVWGELKGKPHPFNLDGVTHFSTCPHADSHRKKSQQSEVKRTLFDISADIRQLDELLEETENDVEQQNIIRAFLEDLGEELDTKLDNYAEYILNRKARAKALSERATAMMELAQSAENLAQHLQDNLQWFFSEHDLKKVETPRHRISLCRNGGKQPIGLNVEAPEDLPQKFQRVRVEADMTAIREALEAGEDLSAIAHWKEKGSHIRIK